MTSPVIQSVYPADNQDGIIVGTPIWIIFDREIDINTLSANFLVEGPDTDRWTGPDLGLYDLPDTPATEHILDSPNFRGIVQGTFSAELLDEDNNTVSTLDTSGLGSGLTTYKHKITFTPTNILSPLTDYIVYITGDENSSDGINTGIATRTVFDPVKGSNVGEGDLVPTGGYKGTVDDVFHFEITTTGGIGTAKYEWYKESQPSVIRTGTCSTRSVTLAGSNGISIVWSAESSTDFQVGDTFSFQVRKPYYLTSSYSWTFTTGSGNITTLPLSTSTSPIGGLGVSASVPLQVVGVSPSVRETNVELDSQVIKIEFNKDLDSTTISDLLVKVESLPVNGDMSIAHYGEMNKILRVEDNFLYIILQSGEDPTV